MADLAARGADGDDGHEGADALAALVDSLNSDDYFLWYRAAEAVANIAMRVRRGATGGAACVVPPISRAVLQSVVKMLRRGADAAQRLVDARSGFSSQESLSDLDAAPEETRCKVEAMFRKRREGEARARRTTMTPQLGVDTMGREGDEPLDWLLKEASGLLELRQEQEEDEVLELARKLEMHDVPLVRYASCKALFAVSGRGEFAERIAAGLVFGVEHHYSQRVLIRDLGDLAYSPGAKAWPSARWWRTALTSWR